MNRPTNPIKLDYGRADSSASLRWIESPHTFVVALAAVFLLTVLAVTGASVTACALILLKTVDVLIAVAWLVAATGIGAAVLAVGRMGGSLGRPLRWVTCAALGLGIMSLATLGLGLVGWLNGLSAWVLVGIGCGSLPFSRRAMYAGGAGPSSAREGSRDEPAAKAASPVGMVRWLWLLCAAAMGIAFVAAFVPPGVLWGDEPNGYDVVEYHLQVPREWYELGRIVPLTHNVFSFFPFNVEMHYLLAMELRGGPWAGMYLAQLMHVGFLALTVAAVYALVAERSKAMATISAVAVATTPWMGLLAPVAYDEGGLLLWGTLSIGLALRGRSDWRSMLLAGVMAGFACGSKLTAVPMILLAMPVICVIVERAKPKAIAAAAVFILAGSVTFSPWLLRNMVWTGNPVFPEATAVFGRAHWSETQVERWKRANHLPRADEQDLHGRLTAGWDQVLGDWRFGFAILPMGLIAARLAWRRRETWVLLLLLGVLSIFWLFFTHLQSRFFTLAIPLAALLIGQLPENRREWICTGIIVAVVGVVGVGACFSKLAGMNSHLFEVLGLEKLRGLTPLADVNLPDDASVVLIGEGRAFLYDLPTTRLWYRTVFDVDAKPGEDSVVAWEKGVPIATGSRFDVLEPNELRRFSQTYWGIPLLPIDFAFRARGNGDSQRSPMKSASHGFEFLGEHALEHFAGGGTGQVR